MPHVKLESLKLGLLKVKPSVKDSSFKQKKARLELESLRLGLSFTETES